jgi:hypothetical protein
VYFHQANSDLLQHDPLDAENILRQQKSLTRLQYMIAFLIEKNERMRQEISARSHEGQS